MTGATPSWDPPFPENFGRLFLRCTNAVFHANTHFAALNDFHDMHTSAPRAGRVLLLLPQRAGGQECCFAEAGSRALCSGSAPNLCTSFLFVRVRGLRGEVVDARLPEGGGRAPDGEAEGGPRRPAG